MVEMLAFLYLSGQWLWTIKTLTEIFLNGKSRSHKSALNVEVNELEQQKIKLGSTPPSDKSKNMSLHRWAPGTPKQYS